MPSAEGHHRPLNARRRPTVATTVPGLLSLRHYDRGWLRGDLLAGVTVAAYLIPQVMAYAQIAGLPPAGGLLAIIAPTLVYAILAIIEVGLLLKYIKKGAPEVVVEDPYEDAKNDDNKQLYFAY